MTLLSAAAESTMVRNVLRRSLPGLIAAVAGLALAAVGLATSSPLLVAIAAGSALVAAASGAVLLRLAAARAEDAGAEAHSIALERIDLFTGGPSQSIIDGETGLADERFFERTLDGRVAAARRHLWPLTLVLLEVNGRNRPVTDFDRTGPPPAEAVGAFAVVLRRTLREADIACRIGPTTFALVLEDTPEEGGVWAAERLQAALAKEQNRSERRAMVGRVAAGVASYPSHAMRATELLLAARSALARALATEWGHGLGAVEVAQAES
jgi:diguanylate cyclase (GGDEF)-like protein